MAHPNSKPQSRADREYILANLPLGTRRVQVLDAQGSQRFRRPDDVDLDKDQILLALDGSPVVMRGKPGRRKKNLQPVTPQIAEVSHARNDYLANSELLAEIEKNPGGDAVLDAVMKGLGEEATNIEFERAEAQRHGRGEEAANLAGRRARVLKALSDSLLKRKQLSEGGIIDLESPVFETLFGLVLETFKSAMTEAGCRGEQIEQTFTRLVSSLDDTWKSEARTRMADKIK